MAKCEIKGKEKREGRKKDSPYLPQDRKNVPFFFSPRARKVAFERTRKLVGGERVTVVAQSSHVIREENFYILGRYPSPLPFDVVIDVDDAIIICPDLLSTRIDGKRIARARVPRIKEKGAEGMGV